MEFPHVRGTRHTTGRCVSFWKTLFVEGPQQGDWPAFPGYCPATHEPFACAADEKDGETAYYYFLFHNSTTHATGRTQGL